MLTHILPNLLLAVLGAGLVGVLVRRQRSRSPGPRATGIGPRLQDGHPAVSAPVRGGTPPVDSPGPAPDGLTLDAPRPKVCVPILLAASGAGILALGAIVPAAMTAAGQGPEDLVHWPMWRLWEAAGVALLVAGAAWRKEARRPAAQPTGPDAEDACPAEPRGCVACGDAALARVCARLPDRTITHVTEALARATGWRAEDLAGMPLGTLLDVASDIGHRASSEEWATSGAPRPIAEIPGGESAPSDADRLRSPHLRMRTPQDPAPASTVPSSVRATLRLAGGGTQPVLAALVAKGDILSACILDTAAMDGVECRARDAETLRRGIAELSPIAILSATQDGTIREANAAATRLLGLPRQSLAGRPLRAVIEQVMAEPVDAERFVARAWHDRARSLSLMVRQPGRPAYPVELLARSFWESPEPILLVFGRGRAYERRLERQLAGIHRLSVLGRLFNGTAHDVNNILATVLGWSQRIGRMSLPESAREPLRIIEKAAVDGAHILRRAADLARGERHGRAEPVDLNGAVADAVAMCRSRLQEALGGIRVEPHLARSVRVWGDVSELRELLINLILNAVEAMPHGGTLRLVTRSEAERVHLAVGDTGHGMDAAVQQRMFEPFFTTKGYRGSGLGLALVKQIAARHRARIEVDTEPGRGTTVRLTFPRSRTEPLEEPPPPRAGAARSGGRGRVLVVDDQEAVRQMVQDVLLEAGHEVRGAASGRQALAACRRGDLDCLLMDLQMPDADGWQLAAQARLLDPCVALVMLSGRGETPEADRGPFDFSLGKPFDLDELLKVVGAAVRLAASRRARAHVAPPPAPH